MSAARAVSAVQEARNDATVPCSECFPVEELPEELQDVAVGLLLRALDTEALYSIPPRHTAAVGFLAFTITASTTMLGRRVVHVLGVPALEGPLLISASVAAYASTLLTQAVVPVRRVAACSLGIPVLTAIHFAEGFHRGSPIDLSILAVLLPWGAAALGAMLARPRAEVSAT